MNYDLVNLEEKMSFFLENKQKGEVFKDKEIKKEILSLEKQYKEIVQLIAFYNEEQEKEAISKDKEFFLNEINLLQKKKKDIIEEFRNFIIKKSKKDSCLKIETAVVEIRPAAGGTEASLFSRELYTMYAKLAEKKRWKLELIETKTDKEGNFFLVSFLIKGKDVFFLLKNEAGVHRVQRVPKTEGSGRIHTSTATIAVLPETTGKINIELKPQDLKIETFGSGGPGGQHMQKTESAIRITHLPTGISAVCQDSKDQRTNRERAIIVLKARILEKKTNEEMNKQKNLRSSMIGSGERSEKIRTYNWPQNRITDHRLGMSWNNLHDILNGNCQEILERLLNYEAINLVDSFLDK